MIRFEQGERYRLNYGIPIITAVWIGIAWQWSLQKSGEYLTYQLGVTKEIKIIRMANWKKFHWKNWKSLQSWILALQT